MSSSRTGKPRLPRFSFRDAPQIDPLQALEIVALWLLLYLLTLMGSVTLLRLGGPAGFHVPGLLSAAVASGVVLRLRPVMRRRPRLTRSSLLGPLVAVSIVTGAHFLLLASGDVASAWRGGTPSVVVLGLLCVAAVHEELVFRGVCFEALSRIGPVLAVCVTSVMFALLHSFNTNVGFIALLNIGLGGVFLGLARLRWGLAAAVGAHAAWNMTTGPLLGHPVSGWDAGAGLLRSEVAGGDAIWTGGAFGIEGGVALTVMLACTILTQLRAGLRSREGVFRRDGFTEPPSSYRMERK